MLRGKVVRKDNSIDFLRTMELPKSIALYTTLSFCLTYLFNFRIKKMMSITPGGGWAVGLEGCGHPSSFGEEEKRRLTTKCWRRGRGKPKDVLLISLPHESEGKSWICEVEFGQGQGGKSASIDPIGRRLRLLHDIVVTHIM